MSDPVTVAISAVSILQPFLPYLEPFRTALQKKIADVIVDAGWEQANTLWAKIAVRFKGDLALHDAAEAVAALPNNAGLQKALTEVLAYRLKDNPDFAEELIKLLGGEERLQEIVVGKEAIVIDIRQTMTGEGIQRIEAGDKAWISGVTQEQTH